MEEHLVIIGGVAAGAKAAAKARRENPHIKISIYNAGEHVSYSACGLPYYIGDIVKTSKRLLVRSPQKFKEKENIDIYTNHQVNAIHPKTKTIEVIDLNTNKQFNITYSKLLIATGAYPFIPPFKNVHLNNILSLRSVLDGEKIKSLVEKDKNVTIVGAGYIGMELAEAFSENSLNITILEAADEILPALDSEMVQELKSHLTQDLKIKIITGDPVSEFAGDNDNNVKQVITKSGSIIDSDFVILSIGVRPQTQIASQAGIELGITGAIKVNNKMETNIKDIYAAGDCAEKFNLITQKPCWVPLGSTANKEGRVAAINMTGKNQIFPGIIGTSIAKVFNYTVAGTGLTEKQCQKEGIEYETAIVSNRDRAGYMPDVGMLMIKLIADKASQKIIGSQITGTGDVDKRINVLATAITAQMTVEEFAETDLAYAPPYSPAIDPVLTAAQVLQNKFDKKVESIKAKDLDNYLNDNPDCCLIDLRNTSDFEKGHHKSAKNCPFDSINIETIKKDLDNKVVLYCKGGMKSYLTALKLTQEGINAKFIDGGCICMRK